MFEAFLMEFIKCMTAHQMVKFTSTNGSKLWNMNMLTSIDDIKTNQYSHIYKSIGFIDEMPLLKKKLYAYFNFI